MNWITILIVAAVVAAFLLLRQSNLISEEAARSYLKQGAMIIDVRSAEEFRSGHLPGAINIPVNELEPQIPARVPNQQTVLLLHCQSGVRSGMGKRVLTKLGYSKVFNLGSYTRAEKILRAANP
jgi:phage shock protein E